MEKGKMTLSQSVIKVMTEMPVGTVFYGRDFQDLVAIYYPRASLKYTDTILRVARHYCRSMFKCVKRATSKYERI